MEFSRWELPGGVTLCVTAVGTRKERHAVAHRLCEAVTGGSLRFTEAGKPYLPGGPEVSLSHSGALAVCAVGPRPIGVDLERRRTVSPRLLARAKTAGYDEKTEFLHWWTAREANCKRLGRGFTWPPLPCPTHCVQGTLEHEGETYYYSVCW